MNKRRVAALGTGLAVAAVSAVLATGALAGSGSAPGAPEAGKDELTDLVGCLRSNGVDAPTAGDPVELKLWLGERAGDDAVESALATCAPPVDKKALAACLAEHGIDLFQLDDFKLKGAEPPEEIDAAYEACLPKPAVAKDA